MKAKNMESTHWASGSDAPAKRHAKGGADAKNASTKQRRYMLAQNQGGKQLKRSVRRMSIRQFVEHHRHSEESDCIYVPGSLPGRPAAMSFYGKTISAARYMCLLTFGTPKYEKAVTRHLCGNGHLSCVNPAHLSWGDASDNQSDANHHRKAGDNVQDRINSTSR